MSAQAGQIQPQHYGSTTKLHADVVQAVVAYKRALHAYRAASAEVERVLREDVPRTLYAGRLRAKANAWAALQRLEKELREVLLGGEP